MTARAQRESEETEMEFITLCLVYINYINCTNGKQGELQNIDHAKCSLKEECKDGAGQYFTQVNRRQEPEMFIGILSSRPTFWAVHVYSTQRWAIAKILCYSSTNACSSFNLSDSASFLDSCT
jgi:hypothetical protein